jgi:hypothetical protein
MSKEYCVDLDLTVGVRVWVDAESEEDARNMAMNKVDANHQVYLKSGIYLDCEVSDIVEFEKE